MPSATTSVRERLRRARRTVRRTVLARRRLLAAVLTAMAAIAAFEAMTAPPPATMPVTVAARDLPAGTVLRDQDLTSVGFAPGTPPDGLAQRPVGQVLAAGVRRGEPITDTRLVGAALAAGQPGIVAMPVRLPDAAMAELLRVGDAIDVLAADPQGGSALPLTSGALVLALPSKSTDTAADGLPGRLVVLGVPRADVPDVAQASVIRFLAFSYSSSPSR